MRIANLNDRLVLLRDGGAVDVHTASAGRFGPDAQSAFEDWSGFCEWAPTANGPAQAYATTELGAPVPRPTQIFAIGLNYVRHAKESGLPLPEQPMVFTKYQSALTGPIGRIALSGDTVDWEVELVAVIGTPAHRVDVASAWDYVAGLTVGQDLSDRTVQQAGNPAQFSLGKSFPGFAPIGPELVTIDEFDNPDDLRVMTELNGTVVQDSRTSDLVFSVPELIAYLSGIVTLLPGDLIFTGTPEGVGLGRTPPSYLTDGDTVVTTIERIGSMRHDMYTPEALLNSSSLIGRGAS
ncbi:fumarylacetoacetate hydrolase family protein [Mycobacterium sp. 21AC1]|uniref:fumarylacetoacetate hydrolase family protein n=1 Tax=[Mycobacterium] appelbergii TaxID=2939269 RepID=UPI00293914B9|nr:fumarylacetoacetate hydrolase family protein [Mycobacterium sp. 21AC1]MDV3123463.1 fumarylacetoacetate hydrolase family protein [Mycobacterium sp. 21AC1]